MISSQDCVFFLWSNPGTYLIGLLNEMSKYNVKVVLVYWDVIPETQLKTQINSNNFLAVKRSTLDTTKLKKLLLIKRPNKIVVSGWMDFDYLSVLYKYKKINKEAKSYCAIDDQWKNNIRQKIGSFIYRIFLNKKVFDYMWVAGKPQLFYASKFGLNYNQVIFDLLVANPKFKSEPNINRRFLYVGRFVNVKGIELLIAAHKLLDNNIREKWKLELIGDGPLVNKIKDSLDSNIIYKGPLFEDDLVIELSKGGVGCCVSLHEPWGVVVHEYCLNSMPIILSNCVGSSSEFLINEFNGFIFESSSISELSCCLLKMTQLSDLQYLEFARNSKNLSKRLAINETIYKFLYHK